MRKLLALSAAAALGAGAFAGSAFADPPKDVPPIIIKKGEAPPADICKTVIQFASVTGYFAACVDDK